MNRDLGQILMFLGIPATIITVSSVLAAGAVLPLHLLLAALPITLVGAGAWLVRLPAGMSTPSPSSD